MLGEIFKKARPDIQNPVTLKRLIVDLIEPESWMAMDAVCLKDKSLEDGENLPEPDELAREIADDLETALAQFRSIANELDGKYRDYARMRS